MGKPQAKGLPEPPPLGASALPAGSYEGQTVIVTGGGTGLGKGIAVEFARLGANLVIASRSEEHLAAGVAAVEEVGARALAVGCDIRKPESVAAMFDATAESFDLPDVLINNAAGNFPVPAEDISPNAWRVVVDIVLNGTFYCSREFGRRHLGAGRPGSIVNVGASYAWTGGPGFAHSAAAKAGVKNMTETLAVEWAPYGVARQRPGPGPVPRTRTRPPTSAPCRSDTRATPCASPPCAPGSGANWVGPRLSWPRPTRPSSPATPWWSTAPTGSAAPCSCRSTSPSGTRWERVRSSSERAAQSAMLRVRFLLSGLLTLRPVGPPPQSWMLEILRRLRSPKLSPFRTLETGPRG